MLDVSVRDMEISDLPKVLDYWFRSPPGFVEAMGVDWAKMPAEAQMKDHLSRRLMVNQQLPKSKLNALTISAAGRAIGFHTLVPVTEGECGVFHAHIWDSEIRRQGVAYQSYPLACLLFFERFNLQKIL